MSDQKDDRPIRFGVFDTPRSTGPGTVEAIGAILTLLWLVGVWAFVRFGPFAETAFAEPASLSDWILRGLAIGLPIVLIWAAIALLRIMSLLREETDQLHAAITTLRQAFLEQSQSAGQGLRTQMEKKIADLMDAQRQTESAIATFATRRDQAPAASDEKPALPADQAPPTVPKPEGQAALALASPPEDLREPISVADFIKAANFPETPDDKDGFRALRLALEDQAASKLIRSAQDILTLLSQDGVYMDDLRPDRAKPEVWRRFAQGERGKLVAALGGIRDRSSLALTSARMKSDPVFRDTAHHFLRQFDRTLMSFETHATDEELAKLGETRSARAFMLLGRVTGMFD